ncbi:dihydroorotase [Mangrovivirga sp. M17]|uniref:Dihydroorotase n=1 Tax=Mangrovivirga halotolerans TaxID=2993936 RepID=A0ABT3RSV7_9BACT|nr:dihydroorotase [Mangrovivirga halotolerans]MCX2744657.1 dihydroorotase [Mangrovivirga halotolerans]
MRSYLISNANIVNEGRIFNGDVLIKGGRIEKISSSISADQADEVIDAEGKYLFPGVIDDQVHFREPGLTHKANIATESRAAVAGGVTSFMEMPNTVPQALTQELLADKYAIAAKNSPANYSFFMGASNDNLDEVLKTDPTKVCGVKIFMGSSTGNMLVDNQQTLESIFGSTNMLIATHCEDEETVRANTAKYVEKYGDDIPIKYHPTIRSEEACYKSSSFAVGLARKHGARLHVLHISTAKELELFSNKLPLEEKKITAEACIHHLWFSDEDYEEKGTLIKWNPAVKKASDREAIWEAVNNNTIDVIATDHAPHTLEEKDNPYMKAPSGGPLIQHSLVAMVDKHKEGKITLEHIAEKMAHSPARLFRIKERGYIREGYYADLTLVDLEGSTPVTKESLLYKCKWSPFEGHTFNSKVTHTFVSGNKVYDNETVIDDKMGMRMEFTVD